MLANLENKSKIIQRGQNTAAWLDKPKIRPKGTQGWKLRTEFHFFMSVTCKQVSLNTIYLVKERLGCRRKWVKIVCSKLTTPCRKSLWNLLVLPNSQSNIKIRVFILKPRKLRLVSLRKKWANLRQEHTCITLCLCNYRSIKQFIPSFLSGAATPLA